jgi:Family of unknown function (DUF6455)
VNAAASFRATAVVPHLMEEPMFNLSANAALSSLRDKWQRMVRKRRSLVELAAYPPRAMTCEPWLPGRRSTSWPMFHKVERRAVRLHEMMTRLHVDAGKLARLRRGDAYAEARARCLSCRMSEQCLRWLDDPAEAEKRPEFCPI